MPTLNWSDCEQTRKAKTAVPFRLLKESQRLSYGDNHSGNLLIQGDNLHALKALLPYYRGQVKCIVIDPPYNTKSAFEHYQDSLEHSKWLDMIFPRLQLLRDLLSEDGSIWVTIDDNEAHYLKVIMDEIFGRGNFVSNVVWQSKDTPGNNASTIAQTHNIVLVFRKSELWKPNLVPRSEKQIANYKNPDNDPRGPWLGTPMTRAEFRDRDCYPLINDVGVEVMPPKGSSWRRPPDEIKRLQMERRIYWGKNGDAEFPMEKKFLSEVKDGVVPQSWWPYDFAGSTRNASAEMKGLFDGEKTFETPKPERIIQRILEIATQENDLVLDSFLGSGTTAAVAHKMKRRYIGIEMGEHAKTHCAARLKKVVDGEQGGISQAVNWQGGGGFSFYQLGAPLFTAEGKIHPEVRFIDLAHYLWFYHTKTYWQGKGGTPLLGVHNDTAYYLLYNGILKDTSHEGGNILTAELLQALPEYNGKKVIYALGRYISEQYLKENAVEFRSIPHQIPEEKISPHKAGR